MLLPLVTATPVPSPSPSIDLEDPWVVSPGIEGFVMFAILGVALWLLIKSMSHHIRKANYRAAEREEELYGPDPRAGHAEDADGIPGGPVR
ncbi:MAG TPA: hypothetical protein GX743_02875 [Actinomycetales bacterium]|nr:hypothetical protein [Actinomycetales bacterium]